MVVSGHPHSYASHMNHAELRAIVHNIADSLESGVGLMVGAYGTDVFGEAALSPEGAITADFLLGDVVEGQPSESLAHAVALYREAFSRLCTGAGGLVEDVREARVRYWSDALQHRFAVTITDSAGRRSTTEYAGIPGRRVKILDRLGRLRPMPSRDQTRRS